MGGWWGQNAKSRKIAVANSNFWRVTVPLSEVSRPTRFSLHLPPRRWAKIQHFSYSTRILGPTQRVLLEAQVYDFHQYNFTASESSAERRSRSIASMSWSWLKRALVINSIMVHGFISSVCEEMCSVSLKPLIIKKLEKGHQFIRENNEF